MYAVFPRFLTHFIYDQLSKINVTDRKTGSYLHLKKANAWLNSPPLTAPDLRGKVVLIANIRRSINDDEYFFIHFSVWL